MITCSSLSSCARRGYKLVEFWGEAVSDAVTFADALRDLLDQLTVLQVVISFTVSVGETDTVSEGTRHCTVSSLGNICFTLSELYCTRFQLLVDVGFQLNVSIKIVLLDC